MPERLPTLFISHGAPDILIRHQASVDTLKDLGYRLPEPRAVVVISAHWIHDPVGITLGEQLATIHDFGGFPAELYRMQYPARGDDDLSRQLARMLEAQGIASELVSDRGLDHGAWIPLHFMYPDARIPVVQLSLPAGSLQDLVELGKALVSLPGEGVLVLGSGGSVHNLRALNPPGPTEGWAVEFEKWLLEAVEQSHFEWLSQEEEFPLNFQYAHPTLEHYAPLIAAWAAGESDRAGRRIHHSFDYGNLGMSFFAFGEPPAG
jgi:4,5-DOPA dioxygenase extradiol